MKKAAFLLLSLPLGVFANPPQQSLIRPGPTWPQSNQQVPAPAKPQLPPPPPIISDAAADKCRIYFEELGLMKKDDIKRLCKDENFALPISTTEFDQCRQQIDSIPVTRYPDKIFPRYPDKTMSVPSIRYSEMLCYTIVHRLAEQKEESQRKNSQPLGAPQQQLEFPLSQNTLACLQDTINGVEPLFFYYEIYNSIALQAMGQKSRMDYVLKDCMKPVGTGYVEGKPYIYNFFHYHSAHRRKSEPDDKVGGLSGMWFDAKENQYYMISDSQRSPFMISMKWDSFNFEKGSPIFDKDISIRKKQKNGKAYRGSYDFEEIIKLPNGNFIASSEVDTPEYEDRETSNNKKKKNDDDKDSDMPRVGRMASPLLEINKDGDVVREVPVAEDIMPSFVEHTYEYDCTPLPPPTTTKPSGDNSGQSGSGGFFWFKSNSPPPPPPPPKPVEKVMCKSISVSREGGFRTNVGIEALSYLASTNELFYGTEASLMQDQFTGPQNFVRIYRQVVGNEQQTQKFEKYPIEEGYNKNGMSAMIALNANDLLILERSFDDLKNETDIRIYKTSLDKRDSHGFLIKKLIVTMNDLRQQMPAGFRHIDNLEGMARGPENEKNLTVLLVSDDNFSANQVTQFIAVAIPKELLK